MYDPIDTETTKDAEEDSERFPDSLTFFESELSEALEQTTDPSDHEEEDE